MQSSGSLPAKSDDGVGDLTVNEVSSARLARNKIGALTPSPNAPGPTRPSSEALNSATSGPRPGAGKKWSEVCEQVQKPDGSVRTSPPFKSAATSAGASPPRLRHPTGWCRRPSRGRTSLYSGIPAKDPSRAGSSRGASSGKSSRSSSRDIARDGDISSRCSSGCWETSTNSSEPVTDIIPSPMESKGLLMPDPIRTGIIPPALLADEPGPDTRVEHAEQSCGYKAADCETTAESMPDTRGVDVSVGMPLRWDPFGRDGVRRQEVKGEWTSDSLAKYLKGVAVQIDNNLNHGRLPTAERLDAFVSRLVLNSQRQLKHAPKKVRHRLQATFTLRFQTFWNFSRNEKVRNISPEELKGILTALVENLSSHDLTPGEPHTLAQPKPVRYYSYGQLRPAVDATA